MNFENIPKKFLKGSIVFNKNILSLFPRILKVVFPKNIKKGEFLVKEGEVSKHFFFIEKGLIRVYEEIYNKDYTLWFYKENSFAASVYSIYYEAPSKEFFEALEDSVVYKIEKNLFFDIIKSDQEITLYAFEELFKELIDYSQKTRRMRFMSAEDRFLDLKKNEPDILNRVNQKHLASYLGIDHTYLCKIFNKYS
jgi:CRP-like cAMP-binding protein